MGLTVSVFALLCEIAAVPYINIFDHIFQSCCQIAIVIIYFGGVLLQVPYIQQYYNDAIVGSLSTVVAIVFFTLFVFILVR